MSVVSLKLGKVSNININPYFDYTLAGQILFIIIILIVLTFNGDSFHCP